MVYVCLSYLLTITVVSHPLPVSILPPICANSQCFHPIILFISSSPSLTFPSHLMQVNFLENFAVTLLTSIHPPEIHLPFCTHKAELAPTLMSQTHTDIPPPLDKPLFVMSPFTIPLVFPRLTSNLCS